MSKWFIYKNARAPRDESRGARENRELLAETETQSGVVRVPVVVQPVPAQHDLVTILIEIRDVEAAEDDTVLHDRLPSEHRLPREELAEDRDALGLDGDEVGQTKLVGELVTRLQVIVDHMAAHDTRLLVVMEPLLHARLKVVLGGARALQVWVHQLLHPIWISRANRPIHTNDEVERGIGGGYNLGWAETASEFRGLLVDGHGVFSFLRVSPLFIARSNPMSPYCLHTLDTQTSSKSTIVGLRFARSLCKQVSTLPPCLKSNGWLGGLHLLP